MTIGEFRCECAEWTKEHWWNGGGACVVLFLIVALVWKRPDNDYLLYAALIMVGAHAYISTLVFGRKRKDRKHVEEIAVAYREHLKLQETISHGTERVNPYPVTAGRDGSSSEGVSRRRHQLAAFPGR